MQRELARPAAAAGRSPFQRTLQRRRRTVATLLIIAVAALVATLVAPAAVFLLVHLVAVATLAVYVGLLIHVRNVSADEEMTELQRGGGS